MFDNTLIGLQDVPTGLEGVHLAQRLASPGARMTLVRIHGGYRVVASSVSAARSNTERGLAESDLNRVSRSTGVLDTLAIGATTTGEGLATAVRERRADLLVLSAAQVLAPSENLLAALGHLTAPVAVTSFYPGHDTTPLRSIGIAYDSSSESDRALTVARRIAGAHGAALTGFQVSARSGLGGNQAASRAAEEIAAFAETVDMLVIAPRPTRPLRRLLGPSTIEAVISSSTTPVMIVPTQATIPPPATPPLSEDWVSAERLALR
jgi:hypothetical protein